MPRTNGRSKSMTPQSIAPAVSPKVCKNRKMKGLEMKFRALSESTSLGLRGMISKCKARGLGRLSGQPVFPAGQVWRDYIHRKWKRCTTCALPLRVVMHSPRPFVAPVSLAAHWLAPHGEHQNMNGWHDFHVPFPLLASFKSFT